MDFAEIPYAASLSTEQADLIRQLVAENLTLEQRWRRYGEAYGKGAAGRDPLVRVKEAVNNRLEELRVLLCDDLSLRRVAESPVTGVALSIAFAVTGKLVFAKFEDVDVIQLGVLISQAGLLTLCQGRL